MKLPKSLERLLAPRINEEKEHFKETLQWYVLELNGAKAKRILKEHER